jgi:hypothetical protein
MARNPFTPTFGADPPQLVGRDSDLEDYREGLEQGPGAPERATLVTGVRGSGKTVMLNAYEHIARELGWLVISETARPGLIRRLTEEHLPTLLREHDPKQTTSRITGASAPGGVGGRQVADLHVPRPSFRSQLNRLTDVLAEAPHHGNGVLLTIDELSGQRRSLEDLRELGDVVQHAFSEHRQVAFVAAGLPSEVADLLSAKAGREEEEDKKGLTFLRRADRRKLGLVGRPSVQAALRMPIHRAGRTIATDAVFPAVEATGGYPFLMQLVGLHAWRAAGDSGEITLEHVERGIQRAREKVGQLVYDSSLADLSPMDRAFLDAMAFDDGPSQIADIAQRMSRDTNYAGQYRLRLLKAELVREDVLRGTLTFTLPYFREYLRTGARMNAHWAAPTGQSSSIVPPRPEDQGQPPPAGGSSPSR